MNFLACLFRKIFNRVKKIKPKKKPGAVTLIQPRPSPEAEINPKSACLYVKDLDKWFSPSIVRSCSYKWFNEKTNGQGIRLAVLDEGLVKHRLLTQLENKIIRKNFTLAPGVNEYTDISGHGTHVSSLLIGPLSLQKGDVCTGLCPDVNRYYHFKIMNAKMGFIDDLNRAIEYIISMPESDRPHFISMSIAVSVKENEYADDVKQAEVNFQKLKDLGVRAFACSGNTGAHIPGWTDPISDRVTYPARSPYVKAIGAINLNENIASFSSQGPEVDYVSYGVDEIGYSNDGQGFAKMSGTSMATPRHVGFEVCFASWLLKRKNMDIKFIMKNMDDLLREYNFVHDLGVPGKDPDYGLGLLRFGT